MILANGAPVIAHVLFTESWNRPADFGHRFIDGRPWFGASKTLRGIVAALPVTGLAAMMLGYPLATGLLIAAGAMLGDLMSSFIKRRLDMPPSSMAPGLDQIPESLLPALLVGSQFGLTWQSTVGVVVAFIVLELVLSRILFVLKIRKHPF